MHGYPRRQSLYEFSVWQTSSKQRANNQQTIVDDGDEEVNGFDLDDDIDSGALVLLTSLDHDNWHLKDKYLDICDSIKDGSATKSFETNEVELSNGCYYKVIVAYKMEKKKSDSISQNRCGCFYPQLMTPKKAPALCYALLLITHKICCCFNLCSTDPSKHLFLLWHFFPGVHMIFVTSPSIRYFLLQIYQ
jgi:hypothetical protein